MSALSIHAQINSELISSGATWSYLDDGTDQGTAWRQPDFDDSSWQSGPAELGFGDFDEATVLTRGPNGNVGLSYITFYFRTFFVLDDPSAVRALEADILRDDGVVVYINGTEVLRDNMPGGLIGFQTEALTFVPEGIYITNSIATSSLVAGTNVVAVEIHQNNNESSDISFDLRLRADLAVGPPVLSSQPQSLEVFEGATATFRFGVSGAQPFSFQWIKDEFDIPDATNATLSITGVTTNDAGFYQVRVTNAEGSTTSDPAILTVLDPGSALQDDFEPDIDLAQWSTFVGLIEANDAGGSVSGQNSLWFGGPEDGRSATTRPLNTTVGGLISYYIRISDGNSFPWEDAEMPGDAVEFEYSVDGGTTWTVIARYDNDNFNQWTFQSFPIPNGAISTGTLFRWRQPSNSGANFDHWAIDDVFISVAPSPPAIVEQPQDRSMVVGGTVAFSVLATGSFPLYYQWDFNGQPIAGATNSTLVLTNILESQAGRYRVIITNDLGLVVSRKTLLSVLQVQGKNFRIASLGTNNATTIQHEPQTGDDRGGIASSSSHVFVTGDESTASFSLEDLTGGRRLEVVRDALASDLATGLLFSLGSGSTPISQGGTVDSLIELDQVNGAPTGVVIPLTDSITMFSGAIFSGFGRIVLHDGNSVYDIDLPTGIVTDRGNMALPERSGCENWATWGIAEFFNDTLYLAYVGFNDQILRARVPDGQTSVIASFAFGLGLSDMCGFTVSPTRDRWYFHWEGSSLFGGSDENLGFADAQFDFNRPDTAPYFVAEPEDAFGLDGGRVSLDSVVFGSEPIAFQWFLAGSPVPGATSPVLTLDPAFVSDTGNYTLVVSNEFGALTSQVARIEVVVPRGVVGLYRDNPNNLFRGDIAASLVRGGFDSVDIVDILNFDLSTIDILLVEQEGNGTSSIIQSALPRIQSWVEQGGRLVVDDFLPNAATPQPHPLILGSPQTLVQSQNGGDLNFVVPFGRPLAQGPAGNLGNGSLDSDGFTHGGFAQRSTLPGNAVPLMFQGALVNNITAFSYGLGEGFVYFSSIPLGFLLATAGEPFDTFGDVFVPNLANYMFELTPSPTIQIGSSPQDVTGLETTTLRLAVVASGEGPISYEWYLNDQRIAGADDSVLQITNAMASDIGDYYAVAANNTSRATSGVARVTLLPAGEEFRILSLGTSDVQVVNNNPITGDDNGPLAVGNLNVLYSGNTSLGAFNLDDLTVASSIGVPRDALVSELNSGIIYTLANGDVPLNPAFGFPSNATTMLEIDESTGALTGNRIDLSAEIPLANAPFSNVGLFSGFDRIIVHNGSRAFHISMPSGTVVDLGPMVAPQHTFPEGWAYSGVAEFFDGNFYIAYAQDSQSIVRARIPDGQTEVIESFTNIGQTAAIGVNIRNGRWYFQHEFSSQFGSEPENLGSAEATFDVSIPDSPPVIRSLSPSRTVFVGATVELRVFATGTAPITYQWSFNEIPISDATNATLSLVDIQDADAGAYQVQVSNALGSTNSAPAALNVIQGAPRFRILDLLADNSDVVNHNNISGDDRGGIALSQDHILYTGDGQTVRYNIADLTGGAGLGANFDSMFSDLSTERLYTLANGSDPLPRGGGNVTTLLELNSANGSPMGTPIPLSTPLNITGSTFSGDIGIFSGFGWMVIHTGSRAYAIEIATGSVLFLGTVSPVNHRNCENWAYWGVAEFFDGAFHIAYNGFSSQILRTRLPDGLTSTISTFNDLSDMCSFVISPSRSRWYFHHEGSSQFGGGGETLGYADALLDFARPPSMPVLGTRFIFEDNNLVLPVVITDDTTEGSNLVFSVTSTNLAVIPPDRVVVEGSGTNFTITATPLPDAFGNSVITIIATDEDGNSASSELRLSVRSISDPPFITLGTNIVILDDAGPTTFANWAPVIATGPPNESNEMITSITVNNDNNALFADQPVIDVDGNLSFTPILDQVGEANVTVVVQDNGSLFFGGRNVSDEVSFTITILPSNKPPVAEDDGFGLLEDVVFNGSLTATDPDGDTLEFFLRTAPAVGVAVVDPGGTFTYTPPANFNGTLGFTFIANDGTVDSEPASITLNIAPVNDAPAFVAGDEVSVLEDAGAQTFSGWATQLSTGPDDESEQNLRFEARVDDPSLIAEGPLVSPDGTLSFTPADDANGVTRLRVVIIDDGGTDDGGVNTSAEQSVELRIVAVNDVPSFSNDGDVTVLEDAGLQTFPGWAFDLSEGPADEEPQNLRFEARVDDPSLLKEGPLVRPDGTLSFAPADNQNGSTLLHVRIIDDGGSEDGGVDRSEEQTVTLSVTAVNDAPGFAKGEDINVDEDSGPQSYPAWATDLSKGPSNESDQALRFEVSALNPSLFADGPVISPDGTLTFTPADNQNGSSLVEVVIRDDGGTDDGGVDASAMQTFNINIGPVNDQPTVEAVNAVVDEDGEVVITLVGEDIDGDPLTYEVVQGPSHGSVSGSGGTDWTYAPNPNYFGPDTWTYRVFDGTVYSAAGTVNVTVNSVNDAPVPMVTVSPLTVVDPSITDLLIVAANNVDAAVTFDASASTDVEDDPLDYYWYEAGALVPFATGVEVTHVFGVGTHEVELVVDDGEDSTSLVVVFEVITGSTANEYVVQLVGDSLLPQNRRQPLIASLKLSGASFDRESFGAGINQLEAFQRKVSAQVVSFDPELAELLVEGVQAILDAMTNGGDAAE